MTIFPSDPGFITGASVIGADHVYRHIPNQDAFKYRAYGYGCVMAAADGVGSDRYSHFGSRAVVQAVHEAFCAYIRGDISRAEITRSITKHYILKLKKRYRSAASTTCIFAAHIAGQGLYLGQIGDGMICGSIDGQPFLLRGGSDSFTNIVVPLSPMRPSPVWNTKFIPEGCLASIRLMLATDGVSEDVLPGREADLTEYLVDRVNAGRACERQKKLLDILENWATPKSLDDKTIVLYRYSRNKPEGKEYG